MTRLPREVEVYLWRRARGNVEVLLVRRSAQLGGYRHCVAGSVEPGETNAQAAARELREETGLVLALADTGVRYAYPVDGDRRHLFAPDVREIAVACFSATVPPHAEIRLDWSTTSSPGTRSPAPATCSATPRWRARWSALSASAACAAGGPRRERGAPAGAA